MNKEKYIDYVKQTFNGKALKLVLNQIELYYDVGEIKHPKKYNIDDDVKLTKGTFMHGIWGGLENFDWTVQNGFIASEFSGIKKAKKFFNNVGMWNIKKDCLLKDYIKLYSGVTLETTIGRGPGSKKEYKLIGYHEFENEIEKINNDEHIFSWRAEQTKEIRFLPSLASNKVQFAFILDMDSDYARKLKEADIFNPKMNKEILKYFIVENFLDDFIETEPNALTTDRESAIMFGLPSKLIEGVLVGRNVEKDTKLLNHIKSKLPHCYICNLDGKVIVE